MPADTTLVRVKANFQITLPLALRRRFRISEGDVLEASSTKLGILLKPKGDVDRTTAFEIVRGRSDLRAGRVVGPSKSSAELDQS